MLQASRVLVFIATLLISAAISAADLPIPGPPSLSAKSHILIDYNSGQVLSADKADKPTEPASVTKLMTTYIIFDELDKGHLDPSDKIKVSKSAWQVEGSKMFLKVGQEVEVEKLLHGLITASGNDAAVALAEHIAGTASTFTDYMNQYADQLGLKNSQFEDVNGLPHPDHHMTARDVATLYAAIVRDFPDLYDEYFAQKEFSFAGIDQKNRNTLLWSDKRVDGGKTGHTSSAGYSLAASAKDDGMRLIAVVMGASSENERKGQTSALLNYGFRFFDNAKLFDEDKTISSIPVWKGDKSELSVVADGPVYVAYPRGKRKDLDISAELPGQLTAPIDEGKKLGKLKIKYNGRTLKEEPLYAAEEVAEGSYISRMIDSIRMKF